MQNIPFFLCKNFEKKKEKKIQLLKLAAVFLVFMALLK